MSSILNSDIELDVQAVKKNKPGKSPGVHSKPIEFLKQTIDVVKSDLQLLVITFYTGGLPRFMWGRALCHYPQGRQ